jgi:hypothetical protein
MMTKFLLLPLILVGCTAPVTDPPAHACSPPLDGSEFTCPTTWPDKDIKLPRKELKGEVDIWNVNQLHQMQFLFLENKRIEQAENNLTQPSDAINSALEEFWEVQDGSDGSTKQEELL